MVMDGLSLDGATEDPMQKAIRDALIVFMAATAAMANGGSPPLAFVPRLVPGGEVGQIPARRVAVTGSCAP
jgi:hypothetical protein